MAKHFVWSEVMEMMSVHRPRKIPRRGGPADMYAAIHRIRLRSSIYEVSGLQPDPRVREEVRSTRTLGAEPKEVDDPRVRGTLIYAAGMLGDGGGFKLAENINFIARRGPWLNIMWNSEHAADIFGPIVSTAWRDFAGMKFTNDWWPGKKA